MYNTSTMIEDARKLPPSAQEEKRKLAIKLWKKNQLIKDVAETVGVSPQAVSGWIKRYKSGGMSALKAQRRGYPEGTNRQLDADQENTIQKLIKDKAPDQLKLDYVLWTRKPYLNQYDFGDYQSGQSPFQDI